MESTLILLPLGLSLIQTKEWSIHVLYTCTFNHGKSHNRNLNLTFDLWTYYNHAIVGFSCSFGWFY